MPSIGTWPNATHSELSCRAYSSRVLVAFLGRSARDTDWRHPRTCPVSRRRFRVRRSDGVLRACRRQGQRCRGPSNSDRAENTSGQASPSWTGGGVPYDRSCYPSAFRAAKLGSIGAAFESSVSHSRTTTTRPARFTMCRMCRERRNSACAFARRRPVRTTNSSSVRKNSSRDRPSARANGLMTPMTLIPVKDVCACVRACACTLLILQGVISVMAHAA